MRFFKKKINNKNQKNETKIKDQDVNSVSYKIQCLEAKKEELEDRIHAIRESIEEFYRNLAENRLAEYTFSYVYSAEDKIKKCQEEIRKILNEIGKLQNQSHIDDNEVSM